MNETGEYLARYSRITADNIEATIESHNVDDDSYMVRSVTGRALIRAYKSRPDETYRFGERVLISRPSASGTVIGAGARILMRSREAKGLSETTPAERRETFAAPPTIISVDPDPLVLWQGGDAGEQVFTGINFDEAAVYDHESITDAEAPEVTPTKVTMTVQASSTAPVGAHDVSLAGQTFKNAVHVMKAPPPPTSLWGWNHAMTALLRVNAKTGALIQTYPVTNGIATAPIVADATYVYAITDTHVLRVKISDGTSQEALHSGREPRLAAAVIGGELFWVSAAFNQEYRMEHGNWGTPVNSEVMQAVNKTYISYPAAVVGNSIFGTSQITGFAGQESVLFAFDTDTDTSLVAPEFDRVLLAMAADDDSLYALASESAVGTNFAFHRYRQSDLGLDDSGGTFTPGGSGDVGAAFMTFADGAAICAYGKPSTGGGFFVVDPDDLTDSLIPILNEGASPEPSFIVGMGVSPTHFYVLMERAGTGRVAKIARQGFAVSYFDTQRMHLCVWTA